MAQEKQYTAKQVASAVLDKVGEILKKSALLKNDLNKAERGHEIGVHKPAVAGGQHIGGGQGTSWAGHYNATNPAGGGAKHKHQQALSELKGMPKPNLPKSEDMGKAEQKGSGGEMSRGSEGHYSNNADPGEPKAGKASKPGKCPECGHPTEATGQGDTLPRTKAQEDWQEDCGMEKYETTNSKKMGYKLSEAGKETRQPEKSDHAFEVEGEKEKKSSDDARLAQQKDPQHNAAEQKEGNNELAGTTPTQVGQDGKNKPGYDEMKGHLKLAKFIGMKHYKRGKALESSQSQSGAEAQHAESIMGKAETGHEKGVHPHLKLGTPGKVGSQGQLYENHGVSHAGRQNQLGGSGNKVNAVSAHQQVLSEMKGMPKPKLPG